VKSFDFFDTLITRDVAYPADIFYFLGRRLFSRGLLAIDPENFHRKRVLAERVARRKKLKEVTIEEIYLEMTSLIEVRHSQLSEFIEEERAIEKDSFDIIHQNTKKLTSESIVVSDFYIEKNFLEEVMRFLKLPYKDIFVSADYNTTKYHGGLFDKVLMQYPIREHIGDNEHSDYRVPLKKNIFAIFYKDSILTSYERLIREDVRINLFERSLISGAMKRARLSKSFDNDSDTVKHNVASNVIAPFLFDYVFFILKKAVENNIQNLYFVARDGQILYKLAEVILTAYDFPVRIKYLYGSRKAWHLAAVKDVDDYVLEWIFDNTDQLRLSDICSRCEISKDELPLFIKERFQDDINLSSKDRRDLREIFASDMCVKNLILFWLQRCKTGLVSKNRPLKTIIASG
jgi:predicted HAD superfamily hydrolase